MSTSRKIVSREDFAKIIKEWQQQGDKVVFTNGCFDLIHLGHVDYLEKAREKGDRLVVGLNSDDSVRRLKGDKRPIMDSKARARILSSMEFVDLVTIFDEETPLNLITSTVPDILVKGKDYSVENIVGSDVVINAGGDVKTVELVDGYSTTQIISKIKKD